MKNKNLNKGIILIFFSALCTSFGQLFWKIGVDSNLFLLIIGFVLYGIGALSMILALKFGDLSIIYPLMCTSYIFALINGSLFLKEHISLVQLLGIIVIITGVIFIARGKSYE
ncbi:EamA family transporter [Clostridium perfringens]|uniref:EamA family transporter n=1 Tax=Clostridium perfringens TaxID=1502 RepID=UPI0034A4777E